jgi:hypothetical protein
MDFSIAEWPLETKGLAFCVQLDTFGLNFGRFAGEFQPAVLSLVDVKFDFVSRECFVMQQQGICRRPNLVRADPKPRAWIRAAIEREQGSDPGQVNAARPAGIN